MFMGIGKGGKGKGDTTPENRNLDHFRGNSPPPDPKSGGRGDSTKGNYLFLELYYQRFFILL